MKRLLLLLLFFAIGTAAQTSKTGRWVEGPESKKPLACASGDMYFSQDIFVAYACGPVNSWIPFGSGGGGGGGGTPVGSTGDLQSKSSGTGFAASHINDNGSQVQVTEDIHFKTGVPYYDVMSYGAVGNGVTDDTTAVGNAYNAACAAGGGEIYFPANHHYKFAWPTLSTCEGWISFHYAGYLSPTNTFTVNQGRIELRGEYQLQSGLAPAFGLTPVSSIDAGSSNPAILLNAVGGAPVVIANTTLWNCVGDCVKNVSAVNVTMKDSYFATKAGSTGYSVNIENGVSAGFNYWMTHDTFSQSANRCAVNLVAAGQVFIEDSEFLNHGICATVAPSGNGAAQLHLKRILTENVSDSAFIAFDTTGGQYSETVIEGVELADCGIGCSYLASNVGGALKISIKSARGFTTGYFNKISGTISAVIDDEDGGALGTGITSNDQITDLSGIIVANSGPSVFGSTAPNPNSSLTAVPTDNSHRALTVYSLANQNTNPLMVLAPSATHQISSHLLDIDLPGSSTTPSSYIGAIGDFHINSAHGSSGLVPLIVGANNSPLTDDIDITDTSDTTQASFAQNIANCGVHGFAGASSNAWKWNPVQGANTVCMGLTHSSTANSDFLFTGFNLASNNANFDTGIYAIPSSFIGTNDLFMQYFAPTSGWVVFRGVTDSGVAINSTGTTPISFRPNDVQTAQFPSSGGLSLFGATSGSFPLTVNATSTTLNLGGVATVNAAGDISVNSCTGCAPPPTAPPFTNLASGTNTAAAMLVGTGASMDFTGSGTINASSLGGKTFASPAAIGTGTPAGATFSGLTLTNSTGGGNQCLHADNAGAVTPTGADCGAGGGGGTFATLGAGTNNSSAMICTTGCSMDFSASGTINASSLGGATMAAPGAIGGTTASTGRFTQITSTATTGTAPLVVASTTNVANLNASSLGGATFAAPGAIGGGTAAAGTFTTLTANTSLAINGGTALTTTNRTGTGNLVLANTPTLITPVIGVATGTSLNLGATGTLSTTAQSGTGSLCMTTSCVMTTPTLGVAQGTSLSVTGQLSSTVATGTAPLVVSSTTNVPNLNSSSLLGNTWASPASIGSGTPNTATFSGVTLTGNALPDVTTTRDLGDATHVFRNVFLQQWNFPGSTVAFVGFPGTCPTPAAGGGGLCYVDSSGLVDMWDPVALTWSPLQTTASGSGLSGMTAGQVPIAATAATITSSKALQGTDANILTSGTISGTLGATLCLDGNSGATTSGCSSGSSGLSGMTPGDIPVAATATTVTSTVATSGTGNLCRVTNCAMVTPNLGTPSAVNLTNATALPATALPALSGVIQTTAGTSVTSFTIANVTTTNATTALNANTCSAAATTVTMTGLTTGMTLNFTPTTDVAASSGWGANGGLVIDAWPTANTINYKICNESAASITPGAVTWNVSAR